MDRANLYKSFQDRYLNKIEIGFRLPGKISLAEAWEEIQAERRGRARVLTLLDGKGEKLQISVRSPGKVYFKCSERYLIILRYGKI